MLRRVKVCKYFDVVGMLHLTLVSQQSLQLYPRFIHYEGTIGTTPGYRTLLYTPSILVTTASTQRCLFQPDLGINILVHNLKFISLVRLYLKNLLFFFVLHSHNYSPVLQLYFSSSSSGSIHKMLIGLDGVNRCKIFRREERAGAREHTVCILPVVKFWDHRPCSPVTHLLLLEKEQKGTIL